MHYTIEFDLDYGNQPESELHDIRNLVRARLLSAGFRSDGRRFTIKRPPAQARELARQTIEQLAKHLATRDQDLYHYVRDFYGYPTTCAENLLVASPDAIEVRTHMKEQVNSAVAGSSFKS
ncbi:MAG: hypothetical protein SV201_00905 [Pseudomonadota bacterium]|nr:hypothetical protein [Pseudomonadota bacterium]